MTGGQAQAPGQTTPELFAALAAAGNPSVAATAGEASSLAARDFTLFSGRSAADRGASEYALLSNATRSQSFRGVTR